MNLIQTESPNPFLSLVVRISALGYLAAVAISFRLWFNIGRDFPAFPVVKFLVPDSGLLADSTFSIHVLPVLLVCALVELAVRPMSPNGLIVAIATSVVLVAADVHRLQPWVYQYILTFFLAALCLGRRNFSFKPVFLLMLFGTYFWSGIHKVNPGFHASVLPYLVRPLLFAPTPPAWLNEAGFAIPFVEATLAVGLLFSRFRPYAILGLLFMHLLILLVIGPLGHVANPVIWPWNVAMIAVLLFVAIDAKETGIKGTKRFSRLALAVAGLFVVVPSLGLVGWWPSYLSMKLYSGNQTQVWIVMDSDQCQDLPPYLQKWILPGDAICAIAVSSWAHAAINVPAFPEADTMIHAAHYFNATYLDKGGEVWLVPRRHPREAGYFSFPGDITSTTTPPPGPVAHRASP